MYFSDQPIYVGFSGPAGVGKTSTANAIAPPLSQFSHHEPPPLVFDHFTLAHPLYSLVGAKRNIRGVDEQSRTLHELHKILQGILNGYIYYDDLVELVYDIYAMDAGEQGESKPRTFMQTAGDMCRAAYTDCFVDETIRRVRVAYSNTIKDYTQHFQDLGEEIQHPHFFALVSDMRRINEFVALRQQPNHIIVRLEASPEVAAQRIFQRDGVIMNADQLNHATEAEAREIDPSWFDFTINTDSLTLKEQVVAVRHFLVESTRAKIAMGEVSNV